jgi:hypothetical protein
MGLRRRAYFSQLGLREKGEFYNLGLLRTARYFRGELDQTHLHHFPDTKDLLLDLYSEKEEKIPIPMGFPIDAIVPETMEIIQMMEYEGVPWEDAVFDYGRMLRGIQLIEAVAIWMEYTEGFELLYSRGIGKKSLRRLRNCPLELYIDRDNPLRTKTLLQNDPDPESGIIDHFAPQDIRRIKHFVFMFLGHKHDIRGVMLCLVQHTISPEKLHLMVRNIEIAAFMLSQYFKIRDLEFEII